MGSGKHSMSKDEKRNSFDNDYYSTSNYETNNYGNRFEENSNTSSNNFENNESIVNNRNIDSVFDNNYAESSFWDEEEKEFNYQKLVIVIAVIAILVIIGALLYKFVFSKPKEEQKLPVEEPKTMSETIEGYKVLGKIKIESLDIDQYILDSTDSKALQNGVGRIDNGASINNYGNFCLAGHNNSKIFEELNKLKVDDEVVLVDKKMEETIYKVTEILEVEPDNLECLLQDETKVELTLITCKEGATQRLVVKAEEKIQ